MSLKLDERITVVDALRGYALMGLFLVHMVEYFELYWYAPEPGPVNIWTFNIFSGKAYAIFALLFGTSFYIIMQRNAQRGTDFRLRFLWRLTVLLGIGYLNGLLYSGEVLQVLAVSGVLLLLLWRAPNWLVIAIGTLLLLQVTTYMFIAWVGSSDHAYTDPFYLTIQQSVYEHYAHGCFVDVVRTNAWQGTLGKWAYMLESGRFANIVGLGALGFWLGRISFFTNITHYRKTYLPLLLIALLGAVICHYGVNVFNLIPHAEKMDDALLDILEMYFDTCMAFASILIFVMLYQHQVSQRVLGLLAAPGRMTLSCYVAQSLIGVPLFYEFGFGAYKYLGQFWALALAVVLWIVQVWAANWWIKHFYYGPLEWCWRVATYATTAIPFSRQDNIC